jgi:hypothetical protein
MVRYANGTEELYDLVADPAESSNLIVAPRPRLRELARSLRQHINGVMNASERPGLDRR